MPASRLPASPRLLPAVLRQFLPGARRPAEMNPLVLVDPAGATAKELLRDLHGLWTTRDAAAAALFPGRILGRELTGVAETTAPHPLEQSLAERPELQPVDGDRRGLAVLLVPEVDQLGAATVQWRFSRLLEAAIRSGVLCCVSLASLTGGSLDPRLASRLAGGLVLPVSQPVHRPPNAVLEAALRRTPLQPPSARRVIAAAARQHGLVPDDLIGPSRRRGVSGPRAIAMFVLRMISGRSLHAIGRSFGGRDHTTVMHAVRLVSERMAHDPTTARDVERLITGVTSHRSCRMDVG